MRETDNEAHEEMTEEETLMALVASLPKRGDQLDFLRSVVDGWLSELGRMHPSQRRWERIEDIRRETKKTANGCSVDIMDKSADRLTLVTAANTYAIRISPDYMGCIALARVSVAGENHLRGSDLHDGKFGRATWDRIMLEIIGYEMVEIPHPAEAWTFGVAQFRTGTTKPAQGNPAVVLDDPEITDPAK